MMDFKKLAEECGRNSESELNTLNTKLIEIKKMLSAYSAMIRQSKSLKSEF